MADYSTLLRDHVRLIRRSIDRIFLQAYVPKLQAVGWVCQYLRWQRGYKIPSSAAFGKIGDADVAAEVHRFAAAEGIPVRYFAKGAGKTVPHAAGFGATDGNHYQARRLTWLNGTSPPTVVA